MYLTWNIITGNLISVIAGIFIVASLWVNDDKKVYKYQIISASILVVSSFFFNSPVGMVVMALVALRFYMVYHDRFTIYWAIFFLIISTSIGFAVNNLGIVGLIPIVATIQITICNYAYRDIRWIKLSLIVNEAFYIFYFWFVFDIASTVVQLITVSIGCISYIKLVRERYSIETNVKA